MRQVAYGGRFLIQGRNTKTVECLKCSGAADQGQFRLVWDGKKFQRICQTCARRLEVFVRENGDIGAVSMANPRFVCWLKEDRFMSVEEALGIGGEE